MNIAIALVLIVLVAVIIGTFEYTLNIFLVAAVLPKTFKSKQSKDQPLSGGNDDTNPVGNIEGSKKE